MSENFHKVSLDELKQLFRIDKEDGSSIADHAIEAIAQLESEIERLRTALRRIRSLEEKNVPKYAQQIAADALRQSHSRT